MRKRVTPPRYSRRAYGVRRGGGCLMYAILGLGIIAGCVVIII